MPRLSRIFHGRCPAWHKCIPKSLRLMLLAVCSLSQTPDARFMDCAGSAFDSTLNILERGVWLIGLVGCKYNWCSVCAEGR